MGRKKNPNNNYFHEGIEEAILLYNKSESELERNRLFRVIYPALAKIAEVMYNKIKPTYVDGDVSDIMMDCTAFLTEKLPFIKEGKGKAFSYMTVTARNYYIQANMVAYKNVGKVVNLDYINENWDINDIEDDRVEQMEQSAALLNAFADYLDENMDKFSSTVSRKSKPVISAVVKLIREIDNIEDFNRRTIMNNLTEIDGMKVDRHYVTQIFNRLEVHYNAFKTHWVKTKKSIPYISKTELTDEEIDFCIENYKAGDRQLGIMGLSKRFMVEQYAIRKELFRVGLCAI